MEMRNLHFVMMWNGNGCMTISGTGYLVFINGILDKYK